MSILSVGSYEAKTHLPQLLREVQTGKTFDISIRGHVVARLSPPSSEPQRGVASAKMLEFMHTQQQSGAGESMDLRKMIDEGRA
jgi:antitoxin (DNA-binding transcriptional repressor) of toxin-antitoxin stability system